MKSYYDALKAVKIGAGTTRDYYTALVSQSLHSAEIAELEGVLPFLFRSSGQSLNDWIIYGNDNGCGDATDNLFDISSTRGFSSNISDWSQTITSDSIIVDTSSIGSIARGCHMELGSFSAGTYTISFDDHGITPITVTLREKGTTISSNQRTVTINSDAELELSCVFRKTIYTLSNIMLNVGSIPKSYEPYGFKIPIICNNQKTPIYIPAPITENDKISQASTGIIIPTQKGNNTISIDTITQPSKMYIQYYK